MTLGSISMTLKAKLTIVQEKVTANKFVYQKKLLHIQILQAFTVLHIFDKFTCYVTEILHIKDLYKILKY